MWNLYISSAGKFISSGYFYLCRIEGRVSSSDPQHTNTRMMINRFLKGAFGSRLYYLMLRNRLSPAVGIEQRHLYHYYSDAAAIGRVPGIEETGFKVFSQFEEDGKLLFVLSVIGMESRRFIEIGADDGLNSNCANLYFYFGYHGLYVDGNGYALNRGRRFYARYPNRWHYPPVFLQSLVTRENINTLCEQQGFTGDVDLLSIDIDGNDYWIWDALEVCRPRVVIIETHVEFGLRNIVVPYDADYQYPGVHPLYHGASARAMIALGKRKGYRLVGANAYGSNLIFVLDALCGDLLPEKQAEDVLGHPSAVSSFGKFEQVKHLPFLDGDKI